MIERTEADIKKNWTSSDVLNDGVCIKCLAYNHEKYIAQCLDGFLMQETTFPFKVVVHDDASTDGTAAIIKEYELKYPEIIEALYEEENLYSSDPSKFSRIMREHCRGKYIAICEGDDYWTDPLKLQLQYNALEDNQNCSICTCMVKSCFEDGSPKSNCFPDNAFKIDRSGIIDKTDLIKMMCPGYPFHTSSFFVRENIYYLRIDGKPSYFKRDVGILLRMITAGNLYYINRPMSIRRYGAKDSWNTRLKKNGKEGLYNVSVDNYLMFFSFDRVTNGEYRDIVFPYMTSVLGNIINYNRIKAIELEKQYIELIGDDEYKKRFNSSVANYSAIDKFKYLTFKKMPVLYDAFSAIWHFLRKQ